MVSAENGALPGGKAGGMGDVVRDVPPALQRLGHQVDVIMPGYGRFSRLAIARHRAEIRSEFRGHPNTVSLFDLPNTHADSGVRCWVLEHRDFSAAGVGVLYCNDPPERPFASDASKFALFCRAVADALMLGLLDDYDVLHLHDWHAAMVLILLRYDPRYQSLKPLRTVFTIHNLSLQGIRPFTGDDSSLSAWFPALSVDVGETADPRYGDCLNPVRAAIRLSDRVHVVSPSYVEEIQKPSVPERGFVGGEGLESDLCQAAEQGRICGILNGCEYGARTGSRKRLKLKSILPVAESSVINWMATKEKADSAHVIALRRIDMWSRRSRSNPARLITSVGRLTAQKMALLRTEVENGKAAIDALLDKLEGRGVLVILGSGDREYEQFFTEVMARREHLVFLKGYSETLSEVLYRNGHLFLMPSSFEPCGISQMLAMRDGQPCIVHGVGGLKDTVRHMQDGFVFSGNSPFEQAREMVRCFDEALSLSLDQPQQWEALCQAASDQRFLWSESVADYYDKLYS